MPNLYITNTNFEFELAQDETLPLRDGLEQHPLLLQLQFLPILFAAEDDRIAVTAQPDPKTFAQKFLLLDNPSSQSFDKIFTWGHSRQVDQWAKEHHLHYAMPNWDTVRRVNSKEFSFTHTPQLPFAQLIHNKNELDEWIKKYHGSAVLKSFFGVSGRGNLLCNTTEENFWEKIKIFCDREWRANRAVIAEPWMQRTLDFSTQWNIKKEMGEICYIGAVIFKNDGRGAYQSTITGNEKKLFKQHEQFLEEHKIEAQKMLKLMQQEGFYGAVGIDSMIYLDPTSQKETLHPIVEVNARQTMSLAAILYQRKKFPEQELMLSYTKVQNNQPGLLPSTLKNKNGETITFTRQLYCSLQ